MGTPEFPDLGKHCYVDDCKLIDFLPFTCDGCRQVFCLEHRSYIKHKCPNADRKDVTVVICPLCAKGVRLNPDQDPNISWEIHVNTNCDPSNYEKATKKKKCPVPGCRELLTFSNTIKCRDCTVDHCLKHRFGPDHKCPEPKKPDPGFQFMSLINRSRKEVPKHNKAAATSSTSSPQWASSFLNAASNLWGVGSSSSKQMEGCPQCQAKFPSVTALVDHVQKVHERSGNRGKNKKVTIDVCPKCSKGFRDPVSLVEHVEREHAGTSKA